MPTSTQIMEYLGLPGINLATFEVNSAKSIYDSGNHALCYIYKDNPELLRLLDSFGKQTLFILCIGLKPHIPKQDQRMILFSPTPKQDFVKAIKRFLVLPELNAGIDPTARIHPNASIHPTASIGAYCIIGACEIGEGSTVESSVIIHDKTIIGKNVHIRSQCVIGAEDFGPIRHPDNSVEMFPQIGGVIIEDNVEIFTSTIVGRGTLANTILRRGVKVDAMCQIGHNTDIGENVVITANSVICGSVSIGKNSYIGVQSVIRNECRIGTSVIVGMGSVVTKSFGDNVIILGNPARIVKPNPEPFQF